MRYIKSSGGYYYKEYANGKRSRISLEEYNKKKNQFNKQQDGSGLSKKKKKLASGIPETGILTQNVINKVNKPIIYLGDLFDSSCKFGSDCEDPEVLNRFSFNIRNIKTIKDNIKNIHIFLGNRDINKLKLLELLKLNDEKDWKKIFTTVEVYEIKKETGF